jgi:hypothetical protein
MTRTFLQRLDGLVRWTGIPAVAAHGQRRRPLRVLPTVALVLATTGLVITLVTRDRLAIGYGLLVLGFAVANFMPIFGPLVPFGAAQRVDEREQALRRSALLVGLAAVGVTAWLGLWLLVALAVVQQLPGEQLVHDMTALAFYLQTLFGAVPTLWASWQLRPLTEDD